MEQTVAPPPMYAPIVVIILMLAGFVWWGMRHGWTPADKDKSPAERKKQGVPIWVWIVLGFVVIRLGLMLVHAENNKAAPEQTKTEELKRP